ncbi:hypothetical protein SLEP1_g32472 [Rubroshorea leprosula]|uniref:Glycosyltransferase n=1 Tax=Rubroshorea leprosula TaxID=152421 RepID=A0AAV5KDE2_9ROSI|nr:hypothetical protein SLEP1_g32472 [Rubroshorea leprosula]
MGSEILQLHIFFFPFMAHGHMIPTVDMAKLFALHGVKTTIVTTPLNAPFFSKTIERSKNSGVDVDIKIIKFPSAQVGLPEGFESLEPSKGMGMDVISKFFLATSLLQEPLEQLLQEFKPDCLVADMFFPWATDAAKKFEIPRLVFHGTSFFSLCVTECLRQYEPHKKVESDDEPFVVPNLPGDIELTRKKLPDFMMQEIETDFTKMLKASRESEMKTNGVVVNSFYELEASYADFYRNFLGRKAWHIGPVSLCNRRIEDKAERGKKASIDEHECLKWLDSKKPNSVVYVCFGSTVNFTSAQLKEIAMGLEDSGQEFIWVVRLDKGNEEEEWLPEGFEERTKGKGLIIRGWAPQVLILEHPAVGGFVTHCGWNSTLEGVSAGVPMVTWPIAAEQFYNEKLVTDVLKIGVSVGVKRWVRVVGDFVNRDAVGKVVKVIMVGEKAEEMRSRAKALGEMAKRAVEKDGSSYSDLNALIQELSQRRGR